MSTITSANASLVVALSPVFPTALIVSCAILLDHSFRRESTLNRCQIQIWMWVALALSSSTLILSSQAAQGANSNANENTGEENDDIETTDTQLRVLFLAWGHFTVFFNLLAILAKELQIRLILPARSKQLVGNSVRILPVCSWLAMLIVGFRITNTRNSQQSSQAFFVRLSFQVFFSSFFSLWFLQWYAHRKRKASVEMQGMPTTGATAAPSDSGECCGGLVARFCGMAPAASLSYHYDNSDDASRINAHSCWLDERRWYTWTRIQTMQWISQQLSSSSSKRGDHNGLSGTRDDDEELHDSILECLAPHYITGDVLDGLSDASQLVTLRVPFGPARRLADSVARLIERYPKPGSTGDWNTIRAEPMGPRHRRCCNSGPEDGSGSRVPNDHSLDLHDQEYNDPEVDRPIKDVRELIADGGSQHLQRDGWPSIQRGEYRQHSHPHSYRFPHDAGARRDTTAEQREQLNNTMKQRFGLELPKLRGADFVDVQKGLWRDAEHRGKAPASSSASDGILPLHPPASGPTRGALHGGTGGDHAAAAAGSPGNAPYRDTPRGPLPIPPDGAAVPDTLLDAMPPQIREIAERRPDLMQTLWKRKQKQAQVPPPRDEARQRGGAGETDGSEGAFDSDEEDEMTSLIERDGNHEHPLRYRSIGKSPSTIGGIV